MNEKFLSLLKMKNESLCGDFNGPFTSLSIEEQIEYLDKYFNIAKSEYQFDQSVNVVNIDEINYLLSEIPFEKFSFRNRKYIKSGSVYSFNKQVYKYISLFNNAHVIDNKIVFDECNHFPLPAFELECAEFKSINFSLYMNSKYSYPIRGIVDTMVPCRNIEFKNRLNEVFKLGLYSNGEVYARVINGDKYHHQNIKVGKIIFDQNNSFELYFSKNAITISINGVSCTFENKISLLPNMMFVGSGIHARFAYTIMLNNVILFNDDKLNIFEKASSSCSDNIGIVNLPYSFGTFINRHKCFVFESDFEVSNLNKLILLNIEEIGPIGDIYVNNKLVCHIDDLSFNSIDTTNFINENKNKLKIIVYPQAPENVVSWHRNNDPYFGSFLGNIYIDEIEKTYIENAHIITKKIDGNKITIECLYHSNVENPIYKTSIYDLNDNLICESLDNELSFTATPWSFDNPKLYRVITKLMDNEFVKDEYEVITGFRTLDQNNGNFVINGKQEILKGALVMQYLPPYEEIVLNHIMPSTSQIIEEVLQAKKMNSNCLRMHHLGYGMNDYRFSRVCDYLGISSIWTTRFIDTSFGIIYDGIWHQKDLYQKQMMRVINSPSIIMWEGANEYYLYREDIDKIYREFVNGVKEVDKTRLISPVSHLYYANDSYDKKCQYYQDSGLQDEYFNKVNAVKEWNDELVVRSAHTYNTLLGYGTTWDKLKAQSWSAQPELLNSKKHMYMVSEYAIIGRQNPNIPEANLYFNNDSYEFIDETINGYKFNDEEWHLSQAYQSLAATYATRKMLALGVDGLLWCSLNGGANDGSYLKPIIDFYGYPKLAFYALKDCFKDNVAFLDDTDIVWGNNHILKPVILTNTNNEQYNISYIIKDMDGKIIYKVNYENVVFDKKIIRLEEKTIPSFAEGYYQLFTEIVKLEDLTINKSREN